MQEQEHFKALKFNGLKISPQKCQFFHGQICRHGYAIPISFCWKIMIYTTGKCDVIRNLGTLKAVKDCKKVQHG